MKKTKNKDKEKGVSEKSVTSWHLQIRTLVAFQLSSIINAKLQGRIDGQNTDMHMPCLVYPVDILLNANHRSGNGSAPLGSNDSFPITWRRHPESCPGGYANPRTRRKWKSNDNFNSTSNSPPSRSGDREYIRSPQILPSIGAVTEVSYTLNSQAVKMSKLVPLTVIKGAGHEFIPLPQGENATVADFHTIRTKTDAPAHITSGFYKIEAGPARPAHYDFEESKYVLSGQIDVLDEATGITHHLVPGDFAFFHVGSKVKFSTQSQGFAFYAVTRPVRAPHPNLKGREEDTKSRL
ncbi:Protein mms22 [Fusarium oxysporum f. sp. albedinis]|nr:Gluconate 5-dehydrogenase [Fusarium oxysporum f. sp. albedinis]KAJ0142862.1 Protein mms22 [Fusarium oxysporum f. sp. albedinis]